MTESAQAPANNTVTWWEIPVQDLEKAKDFYTAVFGWSYQPFGEGYAGIFAGEAMIGGLSEAAGEDVVDGIRIYVQVEDIEHTLELVEKNGGSLKTPRTEVGGDMGWWANFTDAQGRLIGICTNNPAG
jgi:predicted enzyme related to lactoylglutathione lyase